MSEDTPVYQPPAITGYRELTQAELDLVNSLEDLGNNLGATLDELAKVEAFDQRWLAIGRTDMQKGLMSVIRAVTRPDSF